MLGIGESAEAADFHRAILTRRTLSIRLSFRYPLSVNTALKKRLRMNEGKSQPWYRLYASAVIELDPKQFIERVDASEAAIHGRLRDLQYNSDHHEERQLMADAQHTLALLRRLSLNDAAMWHRPNSDELR
jgi:hypothetical protein